MSGAVVHIRTLLNNTNLCGVLDPPREPNHTDPHEHCEKCTEQHVVSGQDPLVCPGCSYVSHEWEDDE